MTTLLHFEMPYSEPHHYDHYSMATHQYQMSAPSYHHAHHASYQPAVQMALTPINIHYQPIYQHNTSQSNASSTPSSPISSPPSTSSFEPKYSNTIEQQSTSSNVPMNIEELDEAADILLEINKSTPTCMGCGVSHTPAWRNGGYLPGGKKRLLCNACGLRYKRNRSGNTSS